MSTVGYATLPVIPSLRGMEREVQSQLGGLTGVANRVGGESGRGFIGNFVSSTVSGLDQLGGAIVDKVTSAARVGAAAGAAVLGAGLWGGLQRALDREDAIITFRRMGLDDAGISQLTDSIDKALTGTPITNPEGFALAGRFLAQGFDSADIPGIVSTLADMSTVGNRSFQEMADVMVSAAGQGRITAAELNRLGDLPLGKVAAELGLTEAGLRDVVSEGELTAEAFIEAFAAVEEFNGAAKDPTTRVAFSNLRTAVSALGEQFLSPVLGEGGKAQQALLALRERVSALGPSVAAAGEAFFGWLIPAVERAADWISGTMIPALRDGAEWFRENRDVIERVATAVGTAAVALGGLGTAIHVIGRIIALTPIGIVLTLASAFVYAWQNSERFREVVTDAFEAVRRVVEPVIEWIVDGIRRLADLFSGNGEPSRRMVQFRDHIASIWESISHIFSSVFESVSESISGFVEWASAVWERWGDDIMIVVGWVFDTVINIIDTALGVIAGVIDVVLGVLSGDWEKAWDGIKRIFSSVWDGIQTAFGNALRAMRDLFAERIAALIVWAQQIPGRFARAVAGLVGRLRTWASESIASARVSFTERVQALIVWFQNLPDRVVSAVRLLAARLFNWARDAIREARVSFTERVQDLIEWFRGIPDRLIGALGNTGTMLKSAGASIMEGFASGIRDAAMAPVNAVKGVVSNVRDWLPGSPAKTGPFSGRGWVLYGGRSVGEAFAEGIGQRSGLVEAATSDLAARAHAGARASLAGLAGGGLGSAPSTAGGTSGARSQDELIDAIWRLLTRDPAVVLDGERLGRILADRQAAGGAV